MFELAIVVDSRSFLLFLEAVCWCAPSRVLFAGITQGRYSSLRILAPSTKSQQSIRNVSGQNIVYLSEAPKLLTLLHVIRRRHFQSPLFVLA